MVDRIIVGLVAGITGQATHGGHFFAEQRATGIKFQDGSTALVVNSDTRAKAFLDILEESKNLQHPVSVSVDKDTNEVNAVRIPTIAKINNLNTDSSGNVIVDLEISHAIHVLSRTNERYDEILKDLKSAEHSHSQVLITETDQGEILDVTTVPHPFFDHFLRNEHVIELDTEREAAPAPDTITSQRAKDLFQMIAGATCVPTTPNNDCIPFLFPDDGCWGRAHEMCRRIGMAGTKTGKVWNYGNLSVRSPNNPRCGVRWGWHVAPTVRVEQAAGEAVLYVVDPSMFSEPVPASKWRSAQNDEASTLVESESSVFYRSVDGRTVSDPDYVETGKVLRTYRLKLKARAAVDGAPPYAHCEVEG
jgi:hypothetical protein